MIYASFGGLLKDFRIRKNLSQKEVAYAMGWTEASRLSRIEQGKTFNPPREIIDRLCLIMKLEEEEKNQLLLAGNYLPMEEEIAHVKAHVGPLIQQWPHPALLFDFSWRIIQQNTLFNSIYYLEGKMTHENILENVFDPEFRQNKILKGKEREQWCKFLIKVLAQYQYMQRTRTKEGWYIRLIKNMMANDLFKESWQEAVLTNEKDIVGNFGYHSLFTQRNSLNRDNFYFFVLPVLKDPRFQVELFMPA